MVSSLAAFRVAICRRSLFYVLEYLQYTCHEATCRRACTHSCLIRATRPDASLSHFELDNMGERHAPVIATTEPSSLLDLLAALPPCLSFIPSSCPCCARRRNNTTHLSCILATASSMSSQVSSAPGLLRHLQPSPWKKRRQPRLPACSRCRCQRPGLVRRTWWMTSSPLREDTVGGERRAGHGG